MKPIITCRNLFTLRGANWPRVKRLSTDRMHKMGTATDILCVDIMTIISLIHVITQVWLGPMLPGAEVTDLVPKTLRRHFEDTSALVMVCPDNSGTQFGTAAEMSCVRSVLGPKCRHHWKA